MAKLTLSVDEAVVERAKGFAARQGTSVSRLVEPYLARSGGRAARKPDLGGQGR